MILDSGYNALEWKVKSLTPMPTFSILVTNRRLKGARLIFMAVWDDILSDRDRQVIQHSGHGKKQGFGDRPVLFIVDAQEHFVGLQTDILSSIAVYATSVGEEAWTAVANIRRLLGVARKAGIPVFYSLSGTRKNETAFDSFQKKRSAEVPFTGVVRELAPRPEDVVIEKRFASAFTGTPLVSFLNGLRVDTLLVCGFTTSGCVRATVVDAVAYNYNVAVVAEGCADRLTISHKVALLDMDMKYADVVNVQEAESYILSRTG